MLLVRLILEADVQLFENEFVSGYHEDDKLLHVSIMNDKARERSYKKQL